MAPFSQIFMPMSNFKSISNELSGMTPGFTADTEGSIPFARVVYIHAQMSFAVRMDLSMCLSAFWK